MNPKDPLHKAGFAQRELFGLMAKAASGFATEQVVGAAANLLLNAIRQAHPARRGALAAYDEMSARSRAVLAEHYDAAGKRRNIFPFHQTIEMPLFDARKNAKAG